MSGGGAGCGRPEGPAGGETERPDREPTAEAAVGQHGSAVSGGATQGRRGEVRDPAAEIISRDRNGGLTAPERAVALHPAFI